MTLTLRARLAVVYTVVIGLLLVGLSLTSLPRSGPPARYRCDRAPDRTDRRAARLRSLRWRSACTRVRSAGQRSGGVRPRGDALLPDLRRHHRPPPRPVGGVRAARAALHARRSAGLSRAAAAVRHPDRLRPVPRVEQPDRSRRSAGRSAAGRCVARGDGRCARTLPQPLAVACAAGSACGGAGGVVDGWYRARAVVAGGGSRRHDRCDEPVTPLAVARRWRRTGRGGAGVQRDLDQARASRSGDAAIQCRSGSRAAHAAGRAARRNRAGAAPPWSRRTVSAVRSAASSKSSTGSSASSIKSSRSRARRPVRFISRLRRSISASSASRSSNSWSRSPSRAESICAVTGAVRSWSTETPAGSDGWC